MIERTERRTHCQAAQWNVQGRTYRRSFQGETDQQIEFVLTDNNKYKVNIWSRSESMLSETSHILLKHDTAERKERSRSIIACGWIIDVIQCEIK